MAEALKQPSPLNDELFKLFYPSIIALVAKRKRRWVLTTEPWEDVSSILVTRVWKKIHLYDRSKAFDRWCNTLLTNAIISLLRDKFYKHAKPCISVGPGGGHCAFNGGDDVCTWKGNPTGVQCAKCPLYAAWQKKREKKHNISATLSLENHTDEVHARAHDWVDIDAGVPVIHRHMLARLPKDEATIYRLLYIRHWSMERVGRKMGFPQQGNNKVPGYQRLKKMMARFREMASEIVANENLAPE